jgi:hypothetical protein
MLRGTPCGGGLHRPTTSPIELCDPLDCIFVYFRTNKVHLEELLRGKGLILIYLLYRRVRPEGSQDIHPNIVRAAVAPNVIAGSNFWLRGFQMRRLDVNMSDGVAMLCF